METFKYDTDIKLKLKINVYDDIHTVYTEIL